jgi:hypothetical protein
VKVVRSPRPKRNYLVVENAVLQDARISFRALGVLTELLSRPDNWSSDSESLAAGRKEGRDAVRTALRELKTVGYVKQERRQDKATGKWETVMYVFDSPRATEDGFPVVGKPGVGLPGAKGQSTERSSPLTPHVVVGGPSPRKCRTHKRRRNGCADCAKPAPVEIPWCGKCSSARDRRVQVGQDDSADGPWQTVWAPCPRCGEDATAHAS